MFWSRYISSGCLLLLVFLLSSCGGGHTTRVIDTPETRELKGWEKPYAVDGQRYNPLRDHQGFSQRGIASWYGRKFHGRKTSNGETYDMYAMTAAHKTLPLGVYVRVTHLQNGRSIVVRVNDRGPFVAGRIIDLSYTGAKKLGIVDAGTANVQVQALGYRQSDRGQISYRPPSSYDAGSFAIQIGAFSVKENADRLAGQMRSRYGKADVQSAQVNGRQLYRVRVGDYQSLERAEKATLDFSSGGFPGSFVVAFD
jgi:peptidoglycan lytic transglycosylase